MSNKTFKWLVYLLVVASPALFIFFTSGCNIQPSQQPKEESPTMVGFYTSPYDALTAGTMSCKAYLMNFHGETYISSSDSNKVSSYMSPCQLDFLMQQPEDTRILVADLVSSTTETDPRLTAMQLDSTDGHTLIQLRNEKMNIDLYLRNNAVTVLPRSKQFSDDTYDRLKLDKTIPDYVDQIASRLVAAGYKFNDATQGQLQFKRGSLAGTAGYNTAIIFFTPTTTK